MKQKRLLLFIVFLLLAALACGTGDDPTPEPTDVPPTDVQPEADEATAVPETNETVEAAPVFTVTPEVTETPTPTQTSTSTPTATATGTPLPPNATNTPLGIPTEIQTLIPTGFPTGLPTFEIPTIEGLPTLPPIGG